MRQQRARQVQTFHRLGEGRYAFSQSWRGIPTASGGRSQYALCLPVDAVPADVRFSDPRAPERAFRHHCVRDERTGRIVCYLECRPSYGSFDFDLELEVLDDPAACGAFAESARALEGLEADVRRASRGQVTIQQFFDNAVSINAAEGATVVHQSEVSGPIVGGGVSGMVGSLGNSSSAHFELEMQELDAVMKSNTDQVLAELELLRTTILARTTDAAECGSACSDVALVPFSAVRGDAAAEALHAGDTPRAGRVLGRLGREGVTMARDLGVNIVAAIIAAQAGIGG